MNNEINLEQFRAWRANPVTEWFMAAIKAQQIENRDSVAEIAAQSSAERAYGLANFRSGYVSALQNVLDFEYQQPEGGNDENA